MARRIVFVSALLLSAMFFPQGADAWSTHWGSHPTGYSPPSLYDNYASVLQRTPGTSRPRAGATLRARPTLRGAALGNLRRGNLVGVPARAGSQTGYVRIVESSGPTDDMYPLANGDRIGMTNGLRGALATLGRGATIPARIRIEIAHEFVVPPGGAGFTVAVSGKGVSRKMAAAITKALTNQIPTTAFGLDMFSPETTALRVHFSNVPRGGITAENISRVGITLSPVDR